MMHHVMMSHACLGHSSFNSIVQDTMDIGVSVHESLPMHWARVCLESLKHVDSSVYRSGRMTGHD